MIWGTRHLLFSGYRYQFPTPCVKLPLQPTQTTNSPRDTLNYLQIFHDSPIHDIMAHSHDGGLGHSHDDPFNGHGHSHDILDGPGSYIDREMPLIEGRDWKDRAFTIGIGGYVTFSLQQKRNSSPYLSNQLPSL